MIKTEIVIIDGIEYQHTWSDEYKQVCRDGQAWDEAYDPIDTNREYTEGDPIVNEEATAEQIVDILLGEDND